MLKAERVLKVKCDTLQELEIYVQEVREIPEVIIISNRIFQRNNIYRGTCNEMFSCWKINIDNICSLEYEFHISNGNMYQDGLFKVNTYNFIKSEKIA